MTHQPRTPPKARNTGCKNPWTDTPSAASVRDLWPNGPGRWPRLDAGGGAKHGVQHMTGISIRGLQLEDFWVHFWCIWTHVAAFWVHLDTFVATGIGLPIKNCHGLQNDSYALRCIALLFTQSKAKQCMLKCGCFPRQPTMDHVFSHKVLDILSVVKKCVRIYLYQGPQEPLKK